MSERVFALLVHDRVEPFETLRATLRSLSVSTYSVPTCREALQLVLQTEPRVVFSDLSLTDGSWLDVLNMAERMGVALNVIVVGDATSPEKAYVSALEHGAFDLVLPPFDPRALAGIILSSEEDVRHRREILARAAA